MKRIITVITLVLALVMILSACGQTTPENTNKSSKTQTQSGNNPTTQPAKPTNDGTTSKETAQPTKSKSEDEQWYDTLPLNNEKNDKKLKISVNGTELTATFADSTAAKELAEKLKSEPVTVKLNEYGGFEKVGKLPWSLTKTDESIVTESGDIMLYQGNQMTIFYNSNSWSYTKLGHIDNIAGEELAKLFGEGNITVTLSY